MPPSTASRGPSRRETFFLVALVAGALVVTVGHATDANGQGGGGKGTGGRASKPLPGLPAANEGAFDGSSVGAVGSNNAVQQPELVHADVPTGGRPSPLFGAEPFTQKLLRFEELGTEPLPTSYAPGSPLPPVASARLGPAGDALDLFLAEPLSAAPSQESDDVDQNPWKTQIEAYLGRTLDAAPAEGRPPGPLWSHQRWSEFPSRVYVTTAQAGARVNRGARDSRQRHGYAKGEFGPGGLYHATADGAAFEGTTAGIEVRFHPRMPVQDPAALWTFDGTFPPKLLVGRYGEPILFRHYNCLPIDPSANLGFGLHTITTHEHNGHNPAESDGFTSAFFFPGQYYDYRWPLVLAGYDTINTTASDPRAGSPDGQGGITRLRGDYRETMSTHWFHDHMLDFTAPNVYKGDAAMFNMYSALDRGDEALDDGVNLRFPSGTALDWGNRDYDVDLLLADKAWTRDGQLWFNIFNTDGFLGDRLLTNWQYHPYLEVRARRYRFRILNGSVSRFFKVALVDQQGARVPFYLIANDGNVMEHAVSFDGTLGTEAGVLPTQGIGERYDIVVDFSRFREGDRLYLVNLMEHTDARGPKRAVPLEQVLSGEYRPVARDEDGDGLPDRWVQGDPCVGKFLELRVRAYAGTDASMDPGDYVSGKKTMLPLPRPSAAELAGARHRTFEFGRSSGTDSKPWTIRTDGGDAVGMDPRRLSAAPRRDSLEVWEIRNGGNGWSHPVHVHFEEGIIQKRDGRDPPEWEKWARKDIYRVGGDDESGSSVEISIRFREFAGTYMEHCHNTRHEDTSMLLRWDVENPGQLVPLPTPIPTWEGCELVDTVALPTAETGDGAGLTAGGRGRAAVPGAPSEPVATAVSSDQVDLSWEAGPGHEDGFEIERRTEPSGLYARVGTAGASRGKPVSFQDGTVAPGTTYTYRVRATSAAGSSLWSSERRVSVPPAPRVGLLLHPRRGYASAPRSRSLPLLLPQLALLAFFVAIRRRPRGTLPLAALLLAVAGASTAQAQEEPRRWGAEYFPNVPLVTHEGRAVRFFDLIRGRVVLVSFIYTSCPDACPLETAKIAEVQRILGDRVGKDIFLYSITIDPDRDTPEVLAKYAARFGARPGWTFLTGKSEDLTLLRRKLGLLGDAPEGLSDHNLSLLLGNQATGQWVKRSPFENPYVIANQLGGWLHGWKLPHSRGREYAKAPRLRTLGEGETLFRTRCAPCHLLGPDDGQLRLGPNLLGVTWRRDRGWLARWLAAPDALIAAKDPTALELQRVANGVAMPNLRLDEEEIALLIEHLDAESQRLAAKLTGPAAAVGRGPSGLDSCCRKRASLALAASPALRSVAALSLGALATVALGLFGFAVTRARSRRVRGVRAALSSDSTWSRHGRRPRSGRSSPAA